MKTQGPHQPVSLEVELQEPYHWWAVVWGLGPPTVAHVVTLLPSVTFLALP